MSLPYQQIKVLPRCFVCDTFDFMKCEHSDQRGVCSIRGQPLWTHGFPVAVTARISFSSPEWVSGELIGFINRRLGNKRCRSTINTNQPGVRVVGGTPISF